jgi:hypothetical protein
MVMEMRSDKIIHDKINSVNDLPEGYSPNLNSKWELLQAGLKSEQNKKSVMYYIQRTSVVAAMLLLIGGSGLLIIKKLTKPITSSPYDWAYAAIIWSRSCFGNRAVKRSSSLLKCIPPSWSPNPAASPDIK